MIGIGSRCLFLAASCVAAFPAARSDAQVPRFDTLIVRTYDPQRLVGDLVTAASRTTDEIMRHAGLVVSWRHCDLPVAAHDPCHLPVAANHLVVRMAAAPATGMPGVLGFTYVDRSPNRGWLATVFGDRLIALADRTRLPREVLIGRAMAHELGHLLLESSAHAKHGFMQAAWSDAMLLRDRPSDWLFMPREAAQMRASLLARSRALPNDLLARRDR